MNERVLVCGGRDYANAPFLAGSLRTIEALFGITCVIHGDSRGADKLADAWAKSRGIPVLPYPADWNTLGNKAGPIRNRRMIVEGYPTLVVAFPGANGTKNMVEQARAESIPVITLTDHP